MSLGRAVQGLGPEALREGEVSGALARCRREKKLRTHVPPRVWHVPALNARLQPANSRWLHNAPQHVGERQEDSPCSEMRARSVLEDMYLQIAQHAANRKLIAETIASGMENVLCTELLPLQANNEVWSLQRGQAIDVRDHDVASPDVRQVGRSHPQLPRPHLRSLEASANPIHDTVQRGRHGNARALEHWQLVRRTCRRLLNQRALLGAISRRSLLDVRTSLALHGAS
mmetsp:Transcript_35823/g.116102  ORF Transcript_35823/g.116102 Transcript_35823/m.116102 type:complete len:229 (-) Transcript_35823:645-1331(-)